jgi:WD40-like Beta Propeller Repeat
MICPCSVSRFRWIRQLCVLICLLVGCCALPPARAQDLDKPVQTIDEDITAFSYAPDGRIVFSVRRMFRHKKYDLQRDDIWLQDSGGRRRRLLLGEKFLRGTGPLFTYAVERFRWSPNLRMISVQLFTTAVVDDTEVPQDAMMTLLLDDSGREIHIGRGDSVIKDGEGASWLQDNSTIVYLNEVIKPRTLFSFLAVNISTAATTKRFEGRTFLAAEPVPHSNVSIAVEQPQSLSGPPRLQRLDLFTQDDKELATLDSYNSGLSVSPSGKKIAYYLDKEVLEVRDLVAPNRVVRLRIGLGSFQWGPDENRILLKRALERKSGDLVWIDLPPLIAPAAGTEVPVSQPAPRPVLHGLTFRDFAISPDGRFLAVNTPGKRNVQIYALSAN